MGYSGAEAARFLWGTFQKACPLKSEGPGLFSSL